LKSEKQDYGKFQWFFFVILIPIIFTVTLVVIILSVAGFDVFGKSKAVLAEIPVIEKLFKDEKQDTINDREIVAQETATQKKEKKQLEQTIEEQAIMIGALEKDVSMKEKEILTLNQEIKFLETQIEETKKADSEKNSKDIAKLYDNMSSKKAAQIIPNLNQDEAVLILTLLDDRHLADILSKMTVEDAVKYTNLLSPNTE
jgi:flagellar protein FlbB